MHFIKVKSGLKTSMHSAPRNNRSTLAVCQARRDLALHVQCMYIHLSFMCHFLVCFWCCCCCCATFLSVVCEVLAIRSITTVLLKCITNLLFVIHFIKVKSGLKTSLYSAPWNNRSTLAVCHARRDLALCIHLSFTCHFLVCFCCCCCASFLSVVCEVLEIEA